MRSQEAMRSGERAVTVKRLHDIDKSWWWMLLFVPIVGAIA
ncbi:DUF805 domain-containing protein [Burkholderia pyrrocinia]